MSASWSSSLGHFVGLLTPIWMFDALGISHTFKQWMAIVLGGVAGIMCFVGITLLVHRRLFDPRIRDDLVVSAISRSCCCSTRS